MFTYKHCISVCMTDMFQSQFIEYPLTCSNLETNDKSEYEINAYSAFPHLYCC